MSRFEDVIVVRFRHCDPAGIVFYPRYFEILNDLVEDWYAAIGWSFSDMIGRQGVAVPLVAIEASFTAPSRLGDRLRASLSIASMGRTSCTLDVRLADAAGHARVRFAPKLVCVRAATLHAEPWPDALRQAMCEAS